MKKYLILFLIFTLSGCAARHVSEIKRVQAYSKDGDLKQKHVEQKDAKFEALLKIVKSGEITNYKTQDDFLKDFDEPVFRKDSREGQEYDHLWLYRYYAKMWGSEKVYLYFDKSGKLLRWEHRQAESQ
ncbi:MAG: hypothetical protein P9M07_05310 [Candidatus Aceula meridiana]|nr:hypothetical protein [Candidatus Aceula meridiana]